jgi:hypothetical protein
LSNLFQPIDFNVFFRLQKEENWNLLSKEKTISISISKEKMSCDGNLFFMVKESGFLSFEQGIQIVLF